MFDITKQEDGKLHTGNIIVKTKSVNAEEKNDQYIINFQLENEEKGFKSRLSFFVKDEVVESKSGKTQYGDAQGRFNYFEGAPESGEYFDATTARKALQGEEKLTRFIRDYANVKKGGSARFADFSKIAKGDLTEINAILTQLPNNNVIVRAGVRGGKYQTVYNGAFERGWSKDAKNIERAIAKETSTAVEYGTPEFKEYDPNAIKPTDENDMIGGFAMPEVPSPGTVSNSLSDMISDEFLADIDKKKDDLPF